MPSITIRDIHDATLDELAARSASKGQSLEAHLRAQLIDLARRPDAEMLIRRVRERKQRTAAG